MHPPLSPHSSPVSAAERKYPHVWLAYVRAREIWNIGGVSEQPSGERTNPRALSTSDATKEHAHCRFWGQMCATRRTRAPLFPQLFTIVSIGSLFEFVYTTVKMCISSLFNETIVHASYAFAKQAH